MKKFISFLIALAILFQCGIVCFAKGNPVIYADSISLNVNELQLIPVSIKDNTGIMGFKITVKYPSEYIEINSVTRGSVTSSGNFNSNVGLKKGTIDIIWNEVSDVKDNGTLFVLSAKLKKEMTDNITIGLSFSQEDTFNENFDDVKLECKNIEISARSDNFQTEKQTDDNKSDSVTVSDSQITDAVRITLEQNEEKNLADVTDTQGFVDSFNKNLEAITGTSEHKAADFETLKNMYYKAYESEFISAAANNISTDIIHSAVDTALDSIGTKSIADTDESNKDEFVKQVEENLKEYSGEIPNISSDLETDDAFDIIEKLYNCANEEQESEDNNSGKGIIIIAVISVLILIFLFVVIITGKKKHNR